MELRSGFIKRDPKPKPVPLGIQRILDSINHQREFFTKVFVQDENDAKTQNDLWSQDIRAKMTRPNGRRPTRPVPFSSWTFAAYWKTFLTLFPQQAVKWFIQLTQKDGGKDERQTI